MDCAVKLFRSAYVFPKTLKVDYFVEKIKIQVTAHCLKTRNNDQKLMISLK